MSKMEKYKPVLKLAFLCLLAVVYVATATKGFDAIQPISTNTFNCLKKAGHSFFIARVWKSIGNYDNTGIQNIKNAKAAGWKYVDGYIFPCLKKSCAPPANQIKATVDKLKAQGAKYGMLWLDVEILEWSKDKAENQKIINAMGKELDKLKINWGIYTNNHNWETIVGINWSEWSKKPLWWANYNGQPDFKKFVPFGGWKKPAIHQYAGSVNGPCGVNMDLNWYP